MNLRDLLITTMDQLAGKVRGLVVSHRGITMQLAAEHDGRRWSALASADNGGNLVEVEGLGASPLEALDECADEVEAIENPDQDGVEPYEHDHVDE